MDETGAWKAEQRYRAVLEVRDGSPVSEVAIRYGVSRQTIHTWRNRYAQDGVAGLQEGSRRPKRTPTRVNSGAGGADLRAAAAAHSVGRSPGPARTQPPQH